jgi:hypothetical protein
MEIVYRLRDNSEFMANVQKATTTTKEFGIEPTDGLFGSGEWWARVDSGQLALHTLRGHVSRVYMASMNDWPEFELTSDSGEKSRWTREANTKEQASMYEVGRHVELDYVLQHHRPAAWDGGSETKVILEIRIGGAAQPAVAADRASPGC